MYGMRDIFARNFLPMMRYPETVHAPARARKFPHIAFPCRISPSPGQRSPSSHVQASDKPMVIPPRIAIASPTIVERVNLSLSRKGESSATQSGPVDTNTTELATDVYSRDEIHVA